MANLLKSILMSVVVAAAAFVPSFALAQGTETIEPDEVFNDLGEDGEDAEGFTIVPAECLGDSAAEVDGEGKPVCGFPQIMQLIANIMGFLMVVALVLATLLFAWAGFQYATSAGNPGQIESAKKIFTNVAIGLAIVFAAYLIVQVTVSTLQVDDEYNIFMED